MKHQILIIVEAYTPNLAYSAVIAEIKRIVIDHFGRKWVDHNEPEQPTVILNTEVTEDDLKKLSDRIDRNFVQLIVIKNCESDKIKGNFIDLSE